LPLNAGEITVSCFARYVLFGLLVCVSGCSSRDDSAKKTWKAMGTFAEITVSGRDTQHLEEYASVAKETLSCLENILSIFKPDSEVSLVNQSAGKSPVAVSASTSEALGFALKYAELSHGCFDPTVGPLVRLWGFNGGTVPEKPPDEAVIRSVLQSTGYRHLTVSNGQAYLDLTGMGVDLGGIAKGYAVDVCYRKLVAMNACNIMIDLGGNIRCGGFARGNRAWKIGVRNPFNREEIIGTINLTDGMAVATSGNYERFVTIGNQRYAHIMDPRTGYPVKGMAGVTVIGANAVETDGMSTALFVLGIKESQTILARMKGCHALFIPDEQPITIYLSPGFRKYFDCLPAYADRLKELPSQVE